MLAGGQASSFKPGRLVGCHRVQPAGHDAGSRAPPPQPLLACSAQCRELGIGGSLIGVGHAGELRDESRSRLRIETLDVAALAFLERGRDVHQHVTGASTADLALVLVDARKGILEQSRRHTFLASLLQVPHIVVCVNKMDLVDYSQEVFEQIRAEFVAFATKLRVPDLSVLPVSALLGDNVVKRSDDMPWFDGPSLLHHLENVHVASDRNLIDVRLPVQYVIRPQSDGWHDYRGYAGQVAGGVLKKGDEVLVLPSGLTSRIAAVETADGEVDEAFPPMSVTVRLEDEIDISRGDMICRPNNAPTVAQDIDAMICWMDETSPLQVGRKYTVKHTTRTGRQVGSSSSTR